VIVAELPAVRLGISADVDLDRDRDVRMLEDPYAPQALYWL
jgi:hypothetical protein